MGHQNSTAVENIVKCMIRCTHSFSSELLYADGKCQPYKVPMNSGSAIFGRVRIVRTRTMIPEPVRADTAPILSGRGNAQMYEGIGRPTSNNGAANIAMTRC